MWSQLISYTGTPENPVLTEQSLWLRLTRGELCHANLHDKKSRVAVLRTPRMFEFTEHGCTQVRTLYFSPPLYQFPALDRNCSCHLTQLLLTRILELPGLTLVSTIFFTRTAGQCRLWLYFCCWNWAISRSRDEVWAVWYKLVKVTQRSLLCFTSVSFARHK